ncbi:hypothetical protein UlMin_021092 [Ulmus minor]
MDILYTLFIFISISSIFLFLTFSLLMIRIFTGKSITNPEYPPIKGTVFNQIFYYKEIFDYHTMLAFKNSTFRLLAVTHSQIFTTDSKNIEHIAKTKFDKYSKGEYNVDLVSDLFGQGIFAVDGAKWRQQRKLASFEFSTRVLKDFSCSVFRRKATKLVGIVSEFSASGRVFDIQDLVMRCTLDSIFKIGYGVELNCLEGSSKESIAFMKAFDSSNALVCWRNVDPFWKLKRFLDIGSEASLKKNIRILDDFVNQIIRNKRKLFASGRESNDKEDILSRFLTESEKDPDSASTLSWFLYMLCKNPIVQEKIAEEVRDVVGGKADEANIDDFVTNITDETLEQMHYLHATLTETLRLYPAVPVDGRSADEDDILPDGFRVKKGDGVLYSAYAMGRMPHIWGEDAQTFRPERWLKNGVFQPESPFKFVSFHAGPRICLGKDFAYRQMKIVSIALLRFFRFKLANQTKPVTYRTMMTLQIDGDLPLCAVSRIVS